MFKMANTMLMAISSISTDARPACSDCAPRLAMPRMDTGRGAEPGLFTALWASFEFVTWWKMEAKPLGEKVWLRPTTSWSVTDHIVERAAPGLASVDTDLVASPPVV